MQSKQLLYLLWVLIFYLPASGQCPLRDTLWKRINFLAANSTPVDIQLAELLGHQSKLSGCPSSTDTTDALLFQRIGVMFYLKTDYQASVTYTLKALKLLEDLQKRMNVNSLQKFKCYWNLIIYYDSLGLADKKNEANDSCVSISLDSKITNVIFLYPIAFKVSHLLDIGDYTRCIYYASLCQSLAEKYGFSNTDVVRDILTPKIDALILLNNYPAVAAELKNKMEEYKHFPIDIRTGNLYQLWASYYLGTGNIDSALLSYRKSYKIYSKIKHVPGCTSSLNGLGFIYSDSLNDYSKALDYYFKALSYYDPKQSISTFTNIGNVYSKKHLYDSAYYYYQKAFDQIHPGLNESVLLKNPNYELLNNFADYLVTLILDKADAHLNQYESTHDDEQIIQALELYRKDDQILDKIKEDQFEIQSKLSWRKNVRRLYEHAIEACWLTKNAEGGLYFFEKSRAVLLDDQLKAEKLMQNQELLEQYQLKTRINRLQNELDTADPHSELFAKAQAEIIRKKEEQDRLLITIREKDPLFNARNLNVDSISIKDIQKTILKDHGAIVEIFNGDSSVFTLTITNEKSWISKIDNHSYDSLSEKFVSYLSNSSLINNHFPEFTSVSRNLYKLIFPDYHLPKGRIIISPDGAFFPFEALVTNKSSDIDYMLKDYSISYTYSARFLMSQFENVTDRKVNDFMGIAPVNYASYLNLPSLAGSDISINQIQSHFSRVYTPLNSAASKSSFLFNFSNYKIVQVYSHASYSDSSGKPVIYFADSSMNLSELFAKEKPAARLVVLSACETALGTDYKGEGVFSFSREFAGLGIPASVSNMWSVDNESTYRITELFYEFLSKGEPTDIALQQAKLKFIKESDLDKSLPFYWAPAILLGKTEVIKTRTEFPLPMIFLILGIMGVLIWIVVKVKSVR